MMKELSGADFTACIHLQVDSERHCSMLRKSRQTLVLFVGLEVGRGGEGTNSNEYRGPQMAAALFSQTRQCVAAWQVYVSYSRTGIKLSRRCQAVSQGRKDMPSSFISVESVLHYSSHAPLPYLPLFHSCEATEWQPAPGVGPGHFISCHWPAIARLLLKSCQPSQHLWDDNPEVAFWMTS